MNDEDRAEVFDQLQRVIVSDVTVRVGMGRDAEDIPPFIADTLSDYFKIALKQDAGLPATTLRVVIFSH